MKPLVIKADKDGTLKMTMEELQNIIDESYNAGYKDGSRESLTWYQPHSVPTTNPAPSWWDQTKYEVTCSSAKDHSMAKQRGD